jgi:DNA-directed RNA polymerase subunit RPC12/RpoP
MSPLIVIPTVLMVVFIVQFFLGKNYYGYRCSNCGNVFSPSPLIALIAPHSFGKKLLRCPECGKVTWAARIPKNYR